MHFFVFVLIINFQFILQDTDTNRCRLHGCFCQNKNARIDIFMNWVDNLEAHLLFEGMGKPEHIFFTYNDMVTEYLFQSN